jgi:hypothetical protein
VATAGQGALTPRVDATVALVGLPATASQGSITVAIAGNVTLALTGLRLIAGQGAFTWALGEEEGIFFTSQNTDMVLTQEVTDMYAPSPPVYLVVTTYPDERQVQVDIPELVV